VCTFQVPTGSCPKSLPFSSCFFGSFAFLFLVPPRMNREKEEFYIKKRVKRKENHLLNFCELPWFLYVQLKRKKEKKRKGKRINQGRRKRKSVNNFVFFCILW
jgi:chloramphenicol O-acetyltransferase